MTITKTYTIAYGIKFWRGDVWNKNKSIVHQFIDTSGKNHTREENTKSIYLYLFIYLSIYPVTIEDHALQESESRPTAYYACSLPNEPPHDKTNKMTVRPAKTHISLGIRPVWSESSLCALRIAKDPSYLHADSEAPNQTGRMPRLTWVFAGRTCHFVGFIMKRIKWATSLPVRPVVMQRD